MGRIFFIFCCICIFCSSCTLTKRHYLPGYNIEWNSENNNSILPNNKAEKADQLQYVTTELVNQVTVEQKDEITAVSVYNDEVKSPTEVYSYKNAEAKAGYKVPFVVKKKILSGAHSPVENQDDVPTSAISSLVLGIMAVAIAFLSVMILISGLSILLILTFPLGVLFSILSITFGTSAINKISAESKETKGKKIARIGIILGAISLILLAITLSLAL